MLAKLNTLSLLGIDVLPVEVEVDVGDADAEDDAGGFARSSG